MSEDTTTCCPECEDSDVQVLARLNYNWRCGDCGAVFEQPDERETEQAGGRAATVGLAAKLEQPDSEVGQR
jgi:ribosomal protein L37AE/L43A